ncbi:MAG: hypothetical protein K0041_07550, partial [Acidithiobacillus sp.]|nr:hypothetical protein [Acidithiobacillus sp.]
RFFLCELCDIAIEDSPALEKNQCGHPQSCPFCGAGGQDISDYGSLMYECPELSANPKHGETYRL